MQNLFQTNNNEIITIEKAINIFFRYGIYTLALYIILFVMLDMDYVKSASMAPTVQVGDICVAYRFAYIKHDVERGDIICFKHDGEKYSKRVIGIAGDKIEFNDGYVYINGEYYDETAYITDEDVETNCTLTFEVPEGCVFVLGDNRENSLDARYWNNPYVSEEDIVSRQLFVIQTHIFKDILKRQQSNITTNIPKYSQYDNPLDITQDGEYFPNMYKEGITTEAANVHIDQIYTGLDANLLLESLGVTKTASNGTSYQVIEYTTTCDITKNYTNIKITGLDGNRLEYKGRCYTTRTYDIFDKAENVYNIYSKLYCYYEVPDGCNEYAISVGEYAGGLGIIAFYKFNNILKGT